MRNNNKLLSLLFILFVCPVIVFGQDAAKMPQWYEIIGGILAIPVTLIGIAYSYILIKKTKLESRKIDLEIREKEDILFEKGVTQSEEVKKIVKPFITTQIIQQIILRYIILELLSRLFGIFAGGYSFLLNSIGITVNNFFRGNDIIFGMAITFFQFLPQIGYTLITIAIGYPLFKDVNKILGIDIKKVFLSPFKKQEKPIA